MTASRKKRRLPESEARPQPDKVGPIRFAVSRRPQAEERVMLHGALPEVLAGSGAVQPEDERVLLLPALNGEAQGARLHGRPRRRRRGATHSKAGSLARGLPGRHPPPPPVSVCSS